MEVMEYLHVDSCFMRSVSLGRFLLTLETWCLCKVEVSYISIMRTVAELSLWLYSKASTFLVSRHHLWKMRQRVRAVKSQVEEQGEMAREKCVVGRVKRETQVTWVLDTVALRVFGLNYKPKETREIII